MEILKFCLELVRREQEKFKIVGIDSKLIKKITAATANDINYDIVYNRFAYLFRCGPVNISFISDCLSNFLINKNDPESSFCEWIRTQSDFTLCSITKGPALEYIAFLLSCSSFLPSNPLIKNTNIVTKYGAWRHTVNIMQQLLTDPHFTPLNNNINLGNVNVIQGDPVINLSTKIMEPIMNSDVVMMIKSFQGNIDDKAVRTNLLTLFSSLKPGAIFMCIETKPIAAEIMKLLCQVPGKYLYGPIPVAVKLNIDCPDDLQTLFGCAPVISARGAFFVWQKSVHMLSVNILTKPDSSYVSENDCSQKIVDLNNPISVSGGIKDNTLSCDSVVGTDSDPNLTKPGNKCSIENVTKSVTDISFSLPQLSHTLSNNSDVLTANKEQNQAVNADAHYDLTCVDQEFQALKRHDPDHINAAKISALTYQVNELTQTIKSMLQADTYKSYPNECREQETFLSKNHTLGCSNSHAQNCGRHISCKSCINGPQAGHFNHVQHNVSNCDKSTAFASYPNECKEQETFLSENHNICCPNSHAHNFGEHRSCISSINGPQAGHFNHAHHNVSNKCDKSTACSSYSCGCKCCDETNSSGSKFTSVQTPHIVIPLNYLSEDTLSQILKSLSLNTKINKE